MIGNNIKNYRMEKGLTQKELADMLHVTAQAVSRWENGDVEPSIGTITDMASIFGVSTDELIKGPSAKPEAEIVQEKVVEKEYVAVESKPVLAVCEQCNKPIYDGDDIVRINHYRRGGSFQTVLCKSCDEANKARDLKNATEYGLKQRKRSFVWGGIITAAILTISLLVTIMNKMGTGAIVASSIISVLFFPFLSCLFLKNNFVGEMVESVILWGFVKFPGVIFELSLGGIAWLIVVKIVFGLLGFILGIAAGVLAIALGLVVSLFVYPFALRKSFAHPELSERF